MTDKIILEYSKEQGCWHFNFIYGGVPEHAENTATYETIGRVSLDKGMMFTRYMDKLAQKRILPEERWDAHLLKDMLELFLDFS